MSKLVFKNKSIFDKIVINNASCVGDDVDRFVSKASLEKLKNIAIPEGVDLENNFDLILTIFNAAVINRLNRNGDGIDTETAKKIKDLFVHKPSNIAHRRERIVGHTVSAGWSSFGSNEVLSDEDISEKTEPFNLVLSSVVYKMVDQKFADLLMESTDESSENFRSISASWELAYDEYIIVRAPAENPKTRNIAEMERIEDEKEIENLSQFLLSEGGKGYDANGRTIGRLIISKKRNDILPIGHAYTTKPAAEVEGVIVRDGTDFESEEEKSEKINKNEKIFSENSKKTVIDINDIFNMEIKTTKDILSLIPNEESHANVAHFISSKIEEESLRIQNEVKAEKEKKEEVEEKLKQLELEFEETKSSFADLQVEMAKMKFEAEAEKSRILFQERMENLNKEFELNSEESKIVVAQIKNLDEESYLEWYNNFSILAKEKKKEVIAAREENLKKLKNTSKASNENQEEEIQEAFENIKEKTNQEIANASLTEQEKSFIKKWEEAFKGNIKVNF